MYIYGNSSSNRVLIMEHLSNSMLGALVSMKGLGLHPVINLINLFKHQDII